MTSHTVKLLQSDDDEIQTMWDKNRDVRPMFSNFSRWDEREDALQSSWDHWEEEEEEEEGEEEEGTRGTKIGKYRVHCLNCNQLTAFGSTFDCNQGGVNAPSIFIFCCGHCESSMVICGDCYRTGDTDTVGQLCMIQKTPYYNEARPVPPPSSQYTVEYAIPDYEECKSKKLDNLIWNVPIYHLNEQIYGPITGHSGGYPSSFCCTKCKRTMEVCDV